MLSTVQYGDVKGPIPLVWYRSCIIKNSNLWLCLMKRINEKVIISSICSVESLPPGPAVIAASPHLAKRTRAKVEWIASPLSHTAFQMAYLLVMIHRPLPTSPPTPLSPLPPPTFLPPNAITIPFPIPLLLWAQLSAYPFHRLFPPYEKKKIIITSGLG